MKWDLHYPRGLRLHRYYSVALKGFQERGKRIKDIVACTKRGAYASLAIIVSPLGAFSSGKTTFLSFSGNTEVSLPLFFPEKRHSCRLVVTLKFRYRNFFRKNDILVV